MGEIQTYGQHNTNNISTRIWFTSTDLTYSYISYGWNTTRFLLYMKYASGERAWILNWILTSKLDKNNCTHKNSVFISRNKMTSYTNFFLPIAFLQAFKIITTTPINYSISPPLLFVCKSPVRFTCINQLKSTNNIKRLSMQ